MIMAVLSKGRAGFEHIPRPHPLLHLRAWPLKCLVACSASRGHVEAQPRVTPNVLDFVPQLSSGKIQTPHLPPQCQGQCQPFRDIYGHQTQMRSWAVLKPLQPHPGPQPRVRTHGLSNAVLSLPPFSFRLSLSSQWSSPSAITKG